MRLGLEKLATAEGKVVLEIGFGTGHALVALAQAVGDSGKGYQMPTAMENLMPKMLPLVIPYFMPKMANYLRRGE